jgi:two-component system, LuxR family, sensor kinase FixL
MSTFYEKLFSADFLPYGNCYSWQPALVWLHALSDGLITLGYYSVPFTLIWFVRRRAPLRLRGLAMLFAGFLVAAGTTHLMSLWNLWHSAFRLEGVIKGVTAVLSVIAAIATIKLAPKVLKLASPNELESINRWLREQVEARATAEDKLRRLLEQERSTSEARVRSYFEAASQGIIVAAQDGQIVLVNRRTEEMFGYTRDELVGAQLERLLPLGLAVAHAGVRKDGTEFPVEIGVSYLETEGGVQALGFVSDITGHQLAADHLAQANAELRRSNAELEQFAYIASHDLQEPLRMIISYMTLLQRRYCGRLDREADEFIHYAVDGASRMKRMIQDFLSVSRIGTQAIRIETVPALAIVQNAVSNLKAAIDESGAIITVGELPTIPADGGLLTQVFQNLVGNAIKFRRDGPPRVNVSAALIGGNWVFSVSDDGIGVEPQYADRIFRIFERLHPPQKYQGSGIGLAVSKKIVERHGGRMWLDSQRGEGALFSFSIPAEKAVVLTEAVGA